jgi:hypothetical protein
MENIEPKIFDDWKCSDINFKEVFDLLQTNTESQAVYWIEQNIVFYNSSCINESRTEDIPISKLSAISLVYKQAICYLNEKENRYTLPGIKLIN